MKQPSIPFFEVELRPFSGGRHVFAFITEDAARRCIAHYAEKARGQANAIASIPGLAAPLCEIESDVVTFRWVSPAGQLSWSAYLRRLTSEDHLWPVRTADIQTPDSCLIRAISGHSSTS